MPRSFVNLATMFHSHTIFGNRWITQMLMENIKEVQDKCKAAMTLYGYKPMNDWTDQHVTFKSVTDFKFK